jgi:uncharacterized membrane protein YgaE (UPF0421/DUF939 family)
MTLHSLYTRIHTRHPARHHARHGLQLAVAVVVSYLASAVVGLPEGFWAVMSTLIVVRPDTGATIGAGWDRVRGTVLGTACGLLGVWLRHVGIGVPAATLSIVALLAFASAGVPLLRSAPITALIILSSGGIAGHSALQVAGLRVAEIAIGVGVGLAVSVVVPAARAVARFNDECAAALRLIAAQVDRSMQRPARSAAEKEAATNEMRMELRKLVMLADSADLEQRLFRRRAIEPRHRSRHGHPPPRRYRTIAQLITRLNQDAALLGRVYDALPKHRDDSQWLELKQTSVSSLTGCAEALTTGATLDASPLTKIDELLAEQRRATAGADERATLLAGPLRLLIDDLRALSRLTGAQAVASRDNA